jgi:regulator of RNase E activity RraA
MSEARSPEAVAELQKKLAVVPTSVASDVMRAHGPDRMVMRGVKSLLPVAGSVSGPARTLRFLPGRSDVKPPRGNLRMRLIDEVRKGEVLVFDALMGACGGVFGDMVAIRALYNGAAAVVTDGTMRDCAGMADVGLPVFASGLFPAGTPTPAIAWESDCPIQCGGALVLPGDWILADGDAVIVIPNALVGEVAEKGNGILKEEVFARALLERGHSLSEAYPLQPGLRRLYERYLTDGKLPNKEEVRGASGA